MSTLQRRMTEDMQLRNLSRNTQRAYLQQVSLFARHFGKSPAQLSQEHIRAWLLHLTSHKKASASSIAVAVAALRFVYGTTLGKDWSFDNVIPSPRVPKRLPVILTPGEVQQFLCAVQSLKHRAILSTCYAAGLRISEAVSLRVSDIDGKRRVIRIVQGKGMKDRYVMLSPKLRELLLDWWRVDKSETWLFPGDVEGQHIRRESVAQVCQKTQRLCGIRKPVTPHSLRHAFAVHLLETGTDIRTIQLLLGHRSITTTSRYLHLTNLKICSTISPFDLMPVPASVGDASSAHC